MLKPFDAILDWRWKTLLRSFWTDNEDQNYILWKIYKFKIKGTVHLVKIIQPLNSSRTI